MPALKQRHLPHGKTYNIRTVTGTTVTGGSIVSGKAYTRSSIRQPTRLSVSDL